ncbi:MAG: hypothetical protein V4494_06850 [Chlamydiota bacterium]
MKEEFNKLMNLLNQHQEGKKIDLDELLKASTIFFKHLQEAFLTADPSEKKDILNMVNEMYAAMAAHAKQISRASGLSQEDIAGYVQNPNNFTPEQWQLMQEARQQIVDSSKGISDHLKQFSNETKQPGGPASSPPPSGPKTDKRPPSSRPKKDKWMKS